MSNSTRSTKVTAAVADLSLATRFLLSIGFKGIEFVSKGNDRITFKFKKFDADYLDSHLEDTSKVAGISSYKYGNSGLVLVRPQSKIVMLKNNPPAAETQNIKSIDPSLFNQVKHVDLLTENVKNLYTEEELLEDKKYEKTNDDETVPHVELPNQLEAQFKLAAVGGKAFQLTYIGKCWEYLNKVKFHGALNKPNFGLIRSSKNFSTRGRWWGSRNLLELSPRLFNAHIDVYVEILLHEMCHQAVNNVNKTIERTEKGHGPLWKSWMVKVGLNPRRYDPRENEHYFSTNELKDQERKLKEQEAEREAAKKRFYVQDSFALTPTPLQVEYQPASVIWNGEVLTGLAVCWADLYASQVAFLPNGSNSTKHKIVRYNAVYQPNSPVDKEALMPYATKVFEYYTKKNGTQAIPSILDKYRRKSK